MHGPRTARLSSLALAAKAKVSADKVRVRLLTDIKDTGRKGEIVMVSDTVPYRTYYVASKRLYLISEA
jgi:hypothetical protein